MTKEDCKVMLKVIEEDIQAHEEYLSALYTRRTVWEDRLNNIGVVYKRERTDMGGIPMSPLGKKIRKTYSNILYRTQSSHPNFDNDPKENEFLDPLDFYNWSMEQGITLRSRLYLINRKGNYSRKNCYYTNTK